VTQQQTLKIPNSKIPNFIKKPTSAPISGQLIMASMMGKKVKIQTGHFVVTHIPVTPGS